MMDLAQKILDSYNPTNEISFRPIDKLFSQISDIDIINIVAKIDSEPGMELPPRENFRYWIAEILRYGAHFFPDVAQKTGLVSASPPKTIHNMHRLDIDVGSLYCPNLIDEVVHAAGRVISGRCLDFGCSSGRVVRVMQAAYPEVEWYGCDPERSAIGWAANQFPKISFSCNKFDPPTIYEDKYFDLVYAISIWSHFDEETSKIWFDEMHRIVKPSGLLYWTTHSKQTLAQWATNKVRQRESLDDICNKLILTGFVFEKAYDKDWSADVSRWGLAYISTDWVLSNLLDKWNLVQYRPGYESWNQDVYLMERR
jgi:SAM-dependent methyltransferase